MMKNDISVEFVKIIDQRRSKRTDVKAGYTFNVYKQATSSATSVHPVTCYIGNDLELIVHPSKHFVEKEYVERKIRYFITQTCPFIFSRINKMWKNLVEKGMVLEGELEPVYATSFKEHDIRNLSFYGNIPYKLNVFTPSLKSIENQSLKQIVSILCNCYHYEGNALTNNKYRSIHNFYELIPTLKTELEEINHHYQLLMNHEEQYVYSF